MRLLVRRIFFGGAVSTRSCGAARCSKRLRERTHEPHARNHACAAACMQGACPRSWKPSPAHCLPLRRRVMPGPNAKPNASSSDDTASTVLLPLDTYGVLPEVPCTFTSSEPTVYGA